MSSSREFPRPPIVLTLTSSASYYAWNKQLRELATDAGVHLHLGFQPNDRPRMPKMYADTATKIRTGQALNERERKEASDHSKSLQQLIDILQDYGNIRLDESIEADRNQKYRNHRY